MTWREKAACWDTNPDLFVIQATNNPPHPDLYQRALEVCGRCPVTAECLEYAVTMNRWAWDVRSVWGGHTSEEISRIRRRRQRRQQRQRQRQRKGSAA